MANDLEILFELAGISSPPVSFSNKNLYKNPFSGSSISPSSTTQDTSNSNSNKIWVGGKKTALLVLAYNRPESLLKTVQQVISVLQSPLNHFKVDIVISQDGDNEVVSNVIDKLFSIISRDIPFCSYLKLSSKHISPTYETGYYFVSNHLMSSFDSLFTVNKYEQAIVLDV